MNKQESFEVLAKLNAIFEIDSKAVQNLVEFRTFCNKALAEDRSDLLKDLIIGGTTERPTLGLLGILNGLLSIRIAAVYVEGRLIGFIEKPEYR